MSLAAGSRLGHYTIVSLLGSGGMDLASQACDERDPLLFILQADTFPGYESVRRDPRFADIRARMRLPARM